MNKTYKVNQLSAQQLEAIQTWAIVTDEVVNADTNAEYEDSRTNWDGVIAADAQNRNKLK